MTTSALDLEPALLDSFDGGALRASLRARAPLPARGGDGATAPSPFARYRPWEPFTPRERGGMVALLLGLTVLAVIALVRADGAWNSATQTELDFVAKITWAASRRV
jgi:hypothetical protein